MKKFKKMEKKKKWKKNRADTDAWSNTNNVVQMRSLVLSALMFGPQYAYVHQICKNQMQCAKKLDRLDFHRAF
jgi:cellobiose-specific phosphotransferase system component IIB